MNLHSQIEIQDNANAVGNGRIVKFVEEKFRTMPPGVAEFDHYKPAEYLLGVSVDEAKQFPGYDAALNAFEALFKRLNALLAAK